MVAINFKKEFAGLVESGKKRQTIRETTKAATGSKLQLYYGQRTKQCRKLRDVVCKGTSAINLYSNRIWMSRNGEIRDDKELDAFARKDGFRDYNEMWKFFESRTKAGCFDGVLITW